MLTSYAIIISHRPLGYTSAFIYIFVMIRRIEFSLGTGGFIERGKNPLYVSWLTAVLKLKLYQRLAPTN